MYFTVHQSVVSFCGAILDCRFCPHFCRPKPLKPTSGFQISAAGENSLLTSCYPHFLWAISLQYGNSEGIQTYSGWWLYPSWKRLFNGKDYPVHDGKQMFETTNQYNLCIQSETLVPWWLSVDTYVQCTVFQMDPGICSTKNLRLFWTVLSTNHQTHSCEQLWN